MMGLNICVSALNCWFVSILSYKHCISGKTMLFHGVFMPINTQFIVSKIPTTGKSIGALRPQNLGSPFHKYSLPPFWMLTNSEPLSATVN